MIQQVTFSPGDVVRVHQRITEGEKTRTQIFEGVVLAIRGRGENKSFTVRKVANGIAVERVWPVGSPALIQVEKKAEPRKRIRRAKQYNLRKTVR